MVLVWNFSPTSFDGLSAVSACDGSISFAWNSGAVKAGNNGSILAMNTSLLHFKVVKAILFLLVILFFMREVVKVIKGMNDFNTFQNQNVKSFQRMAYGSLAVFFLKIPVYGITDGVLGMTLKMEFTPLMVALALFVLAEVFKEGNNLYEEQKFTV